jgi:hypothetical protein
MTSRRSRIAALVLLAVVVLGDISYRIAIQDLYDLAHVRYPQNVWSLGFGAIVVLCGIGYLAATTAWRRRDPADRQALVVTAIVMFVALFVFANVAPGERMIPPGVYFVLQALLWNLTGVLVLLLARNESTAMAIVLRIYAVLLVAVQSVVGVIGTSYAGDAAMTYVAAAIAVAGTLAALALALRERRFAQSETAIP